MIKLLNRVLVISSLSLAASAVSAGSYWQTSSGAPLQTAKGECVNADLAQHTVAACKPADRIILLPGADGKAGAVLVSSEGQQQRLDKAYTSLAKSDEGLAEQAVSEAEVKDQFGRLLDAQPKSVTSFTVKFVSGSATELTPEADAVIEQLIAEVESRESAEIRLVGHTDSVGDLLKNDVLSQQRAQAVVDILAARGVDRDVMEATGRGEREPAMARGDNVSEAANRRVDIRVR